MVRTLRLVTGIVLMAYVTSHLLNHALGLVSLDTMETGRIWFLAVWRNPLGTFVFLLSLAVHFGLALWSLYQRRSLAMPWGEAAQLVLGFAIPFLLIGHVIGTRGAHQLAGVNDTYAYVMLVHWVFDTSYIWQQILALLVAWVHGCIGIHYWLRLKPFYAKYLPELYAAALLVPVLSLLGYAEAGRDVIELAKDRAWMREAGAIIQWPDKAETAQLLALIDRTKIAVGALIAIALAARIARSILERWRGTVRVTYPGDLVVSSLPGASILEISRARGIPHASVCGGRGRCSTCRVRVSRGIDDLPPVSASEQRVLDRIGSPISVRLACQTRPTADVSVIPLLPPTATPSDAHPRAARLQGEEREIAILFADLRAFTHFSEKKLPYDVVFVLNRYFASMGEAVESAGGHLDKFIGDGVMALFGTEGGVATACRQSLVAAKAMSAALAELNRTLENDLDEPFRIGIGIYAGPAIVGEMGYGAATGITAIGDAVNTASRLETMTKEFRAQLVVSQDVAERADVDLSAYPTHEIEVRGREEPVAVRVIEHAGELPI
jgi:adenylate cyclase